MWVRVYGGGVFFPPDNWTLKKVCVKLQTTKKESLARFWYKISERQVNTAEMDIRWVLQRMQNIQGCLEEAWMRGVKDLLMEESREYIRNRRNVREQVPYEKGIMMDVLWLGANWPTPTAHYNTPNNPVKWWGTRKTGDHRPSEDRHDDEALTERKESLSATSDLNNDLSHIDLWLL